MANDTVVTADERRRADEARIDASIREKLTCTRIGDMGGCGRPIVPVYHNRFVSWTCVTPGCRRMINGAEIIGRVAEIVVGALGRTDTKAAEAAIRRYEQSLFGGKRNARR